MTIKKLNPRDVFGEVLLDLGRENKNIMAVSCDSGSGSGMNPFKKELPHQYLEVGINEQNAIGVCAGLAEGGFIPIVSAIAPFISMRAFEQIRNDLGYANMNVKVIGSSSGLSHSALGSTHQAIEDLTLMRVVPNMVVLNPGDGYEVEMSLKKAIRHKGPVYIRMPRHAMAEPLEATERNFEIGKGEVLMNSGDDIVIAVSGTLSVDGFMAGKILDEMGYGVKVLNFTTVKPLDTKLLCEAYKSAKYLFTLEEHSVIGGFGSAVLEALASVKHEAPIHLIGITDGSIKTGPYRELLEAYGLTWEKVADRILNEIKNN
ncbi:transketolase family protein [Acetobacterium woodii]|uniref:Transketolase, subunit B n=1 Tax=Acetobacterium woodii (strain ATCC 29683 / DSM 1030 / JCM 2381 / KCTC 1655 / WB1) TaxID=931626 RepID=H6LDY9_ACEWD|nr:transketolase C-terminal domain-containing protein [Acetobacterium woodii]AFA48032.1 transketolase, subunit B [Acetobacterium woodii DSM 1030]